MSFIEVIILGIVQGLTEFLPVSSSGHLVLLEQVFGISEGVLFLNICLHVATLVAVVLFYRKRLWALIKKPFGKESRLLILATLPTVLMVVLFKDFFEGSFSGTFLAFGFIVSAIFLCITEFVSLHYERTKFIAKPVGTPQSLILGVMQGFAILPGISRSGTTLCTGIVLGIEKKQAIEFSFLMSIPIIVASLVYELAKADFVATVDAVSVPMLAVGSIFAFAFAVLGIKLMLKVVEKVKYSWFALYLLGLAVITSFVI